MGDRVGKSRQATEVRLKNRRNVNRPLRPMPSRAIEAGSGIVVTVAETRSPVTEPNTFFVSNTIVFVPLTKSLLGALQECKVENPHGGPPAGGIAGIVVLNV